MNGYNPECESVTGKPKSKHITSNKKKSRNYTIVVA